MRTISMYIGLLTVAITLTLAAGCGGGGSHSPVVTPTIPPPTATPTPTPTPTPGPATIVVTFLGSAQPSAVAAQIGTGAWTASSLSGNTLTVNLPAGTTKYAIGYVCPPFTGPSQPYAAEDIIEATVADGTTYSLTCSPTLSTGTATGSANALAIASASDVQIYGASDFRQDNFGAVGSANGTFSATLPNDTTDVAAVAIDTSKNVVGVKVLHSQTLPGAVNGGNPITFAAGDATTAQTITVTNGVSPSMDVEYHTANTTSFPLNNSSATQYAVVPASSTQSGDYYEFNASVSGAGAAVGTVRTSPSAIAANLALPNFWTFNPPTVAKFPTFNFDYTGFSSSTAIGEEVYLIWNPTPTAIANYLSVTATAAYQNGTTTVTIPDLTSLTGFFAAPPSTKAVTWIMDEWSGPQQWYTFYNAIPTSGSISYIETIGTYIQP